MLTRLTGNGAPGSPKALQRILSFIWPSVKTNQVHYKSSISEATSPIDFFTNELVNNNSKKWEELRDNLIKKTDGHSATNNDANLSGTSFTQSVGLMSKSVVNDLQTLRSPSLGLDIRSLSQAQLDNLLLSTLEIKNKVDFLYLIRQCIRWQQLPSNAVLISCLKYLSTISRFQHIEAFAEICTAQDHPLTKTFANFAPFKAMALWRSGGADVALMILHRGYSESNESEEGRRMLRNAFRTIAEETLAQKSEAVLVALMEVARSIYTEHKDIFVIACIWKQCFISDWFCDQNTATDLFEHYQELQQLVCKRSTSLCASFLKTNNVDAVHRLIEVFLRHNQRDECSNCLRLLFDYQYLRKDLRACAEIVKSCSELDMPLSELQNERFLSLFLNQTDPSTIPPSVASSVTRPNKIRKSFKEFQYKF